jgi:AraC-like DNA-binding protein
MHDTLWHTHFDVTRIDGFPVLSGMARERVARGYLSEGKYRKAEQHCIFHYCLDGEGETWVGQQRHRVPAGSGFLNIVNDPHSGYRYPPKGRTAWNFVWIAFSGGEVREICRSLIRRYGPVFELPESHPVIEQFMVWGGQRERRVAMRPDQMAMAVWQLVATLGRIGELRIRPPEAQRLAERACRIIDAAGVDLPVVKQVAHELGVSREHLSRVFREQMGRTIQDHLSRRRVLHACRLLKDTDLQITKIAERMGYGTPANFARAFKRVMHLSPLKFRQYGVVPIL